MKLKSVLNHSVAVNFILLKGICSFPKVVAYIFFVVGMMCRSFAIMPFVQGKWVEWHACGTSLSKDLVGMDYDSVFVSTFVEEVFWQICLKA